MGLLATVCGVLAAQGESGSLALSLLHFHKDNDFL
jgi:hypothetical protein